MTLQTQNLSATGHQPVQQRPLGIRNHLPTPGTSHHAHHSTHCRGTVGSTQNKDLYYTTAEVSMISLDVEIELNLKQEQERQPKTPHP